MGETVLRRFYNNVLAVIREISVEPAYLGMALSWGLYGIVSSELYISKVCKVNLALGDEICDNIQVHKEEQAEVQKYVSTLKIYNSVLQAIPSVLFTLFAGSWSDVHGRKALIVSSTFGYCISNLVFMINAHFFYELKAEYLLLECLQDCTGGGVVFFMACNAYLADITEPKHRTKRVAFMTGCFWIGYNSGKALSGVIKEELGFMYNFGLGMLVSVLTGVYAIVFLKDSTRIREERLRREATSDEKGDGTVKKDMKVLTKSTFKEKLTDLFSLVNVKAGVKSVFTKRQHNLRVLIFLMIFCFEMEQFINVGDWGNQYLYLRRKLDWDIIDYTTFTIVVGVVGLAAQYIAIPLLSEKFNLRDSTIIIIDITGCFIQTVILSLATATWMVYLGAFIAFLDTTSYSMIRCMISKNVKPDEVGKILSFVGAVQAFIPIISSPLFGMIYRSTVETLPQTYLIVLAGLFFVDLCVLIYIDRGMRAMNLAKTVEFDDMRKKEEVQDVLDNLLKPEDHDSVEIDDKEKKCGTCDKCKEKKGTISDESDK